MSEQGTQSTTTDPLDDEVFLAYKKGREAFVVSDAQRKAESARRFLKGAARAREILPGFIENAVRENCDVNMEAHVVDGEGAFDFCEGMLSVFNRYKPCIHARSTPHETADGVWRIEVLVDFEMFERWVAHRSHKTTTGDK